MLDAIIVGGGPAGLSAALTLGRARRQVLLLDGGPGRNAPSDAVHNYLTQDGTSVAEFRAMALKQLTVYPSVRLLQERQACAVDADSMLRLTLDDSTQQTARRLLLATGVEDVLPEIEGFAERWGRSVVHCAYCHGWERREMPIAVLDLGGLGVHQAVRLARFSDDVILCTNGGPAPAPEQQALLDERGIAVRDVPIARLAGADRDLEQLIFTDGTACARRALFVHPHTRQRSDLPQQFGCNLLDEGSVEVDDFGRTSVAGVYAAGDMARRPGALPGAQVVIAAAEGTTAAIAIDQELVYVS